MHKTKPKQSVLCFLLVVVFLEDDRVTYVTEPELRSLREVTVDGSTAKLMSYWYYVQVVQSTRYQ